jgi:hypothetical protein
MFEMYLIFRLHRRIPRPHLGLQFNAISLLNPAHVEQILVVCGVDEGLVVQEVHIVCSWFPEFACFVVHTKD